MEKSELESVLNQKIKDLKISEGAAAGAGVAGALLAFEVTTDSAEKLHLVHKALEQDPRKKEFIIRNQSFAVETQFYKKLVPALEEFAKSKNFTQLPVLSIPKYYGGVLNNDTDFLLLEDLRADGFEMCDKYPGFALDEASLILKDLAKFHAVTYAFLKWEGDKILEHEDFKIFCRNLLEDPEFRIMGALMFNSAFELAIDLVAARNAELGQKMKNFDAGMRTLEQMHDTAFKTDKEFFPVFVLGDLWINNIMAKRDKNGKLQIKFIDFQISRRGNIFEDLQYFIFTSTTPAFRAAHLTQVLETYHESFAKTLGQLGCQPPMGFTKGFLIDNFFKCYRAAFKYVAFAIPFQLGNIETMFEAPAEGGDGTGGPPPGALPNDLDPVQMMEMQMKMMAEGLKRSMVTSPRAIERLCNVAEEMSQLNVI